MNLEKAVEFVRRTGNAIEQARLKYLWANERPAPEVLTQFFTGQQPDGGWAPVWAQAYSSLDATCFRLAQAEQMGLTASEAAVRRALHFLAQGQSAEGSWEENQQIANVAPLWAKPGDLSAKLYLTANCGLWLALWGDPDTQAAKAAVYLQKHLAQEGQLPSFIHTHWLAGGLWYQLNWREPAERTLEYLSNRINTLATSNLAWLITTLRAAGVPPQQPLVNTAIALLAQSQQDDGRWPSEDGPSQDVHSTLEALRALWLCGRIMKP